MHRFTPKPANDFKQFYNLYYEECRRHAPWIAAIAAKWRFEDLIPGLSDFDTRFIADGDLTTADWCAMSAAVGAVHLDLCRRFPHWSRMLEHLPGINLTWTELTDDGMYYPEYPLWTFYRTEDAPRLAATERYFRERAWEERDEYYQLKKFCLYYGRYNRQIDPPINLGLFEDKYPLHSRFMHYFAPPLQAAVSLLLRRPVTGKLEALRLAGEMFPNPVFGEMSDAIQRHYEVPELYGEPALTRLEDRLEQALEMLRQEMSARLTLIHDAGRKRMADWKKDLLHVPVSPAMQVIDGARFSRLMKGRLQFFAHAPAHFDSDLLIECELRRLRQSFFEAPYRVYWEVTAGEKVADPAALLPRLCPDPLTPEELRCTQEFVRLLPGHWEPGRQKAIALELMAIFDGFFSGLTKVTRCVCQMKKEPAGCR